jgi:branched-chain amino acid transport system ATP-binding protein
VRAAGTLDKGLSVEETVQAVDTLARFLEASRMTVLLVEHDMEVVFRLAHRITVLHRGAVLPMACLTK